MRWCGRLSGGLVVAVLLVLSVVRAEAGPWNGWVYQNPFPTSNTLLSVKFVTPEIGWVVGENGTILYTETGGEEWEFQESGTDQDLKSVTFVDKKVGWVVGNGGVILHTEDGGRKWIRQGDVKGSLHTVFFLNGKNGWIGGEVGTLLQTDDGGKSWNTYDLRALSDIASIFFIDAKTGWILSAGMVFKTIDAGKTWDFSELPPINFMGRRFDKPALHGWEGGIHFLDAKKGFVTVGLPFIFSTDDGGKTWKYNKIVHTAERVSFNDENRGCIVGTSVLCTEDRGKTWDERLGIKSNDSSTIALWGISFVDKYTGFAVGKKGFSSTAAQIWKTDDGGIIWKTNIDNEEYAYILNSEIAWCWQGNSFKITKDGGRTFIAQKEFRQDTYLNFFFINETIGWAAGKKEERDRYKGPVIDNYFIIHTIDGGKTWETQFNEIGGEMSVSNDFQDIHFINPDLGWAVGSNGLALNTLDGGKNWRHQKSGTKFRLRKVQFVDENNGWAIGDDISSELGSAVIILHTKNGGRNWQIKSERKADWITLRELHFIDDKTGWAMGDINEYSGDAILFKTNDAGVTWKEKVFKKLFIDRFYFIDKNKGVILTANKSILVTRDGGDTWEIKIKPIHRHPWHVSEIFNKE